MRELRDEIIDIIGENVLLVTGPECFRSADEIVDLLAAKEAQEKAPADNRLAELLGAIRDGMSMHSFKTDSGEWVLDEATINEILAKFKGAKS